MPCIVIAGAGGAIGGEVARLFSADGYHVVAADLDGDRVGKLARTLPAVTAVAADLSTSAGADEVMSAVDGTVDVLVNAVGMSDGRLDVDEIDDDAWDRLIAVNLRSVFLLTSRCSRVMVESGGGTIINLSSVAGIRGGRTGVAYTTTKWGIVGLTKNVAHTLGPLGVRCMALAPGRVSGAVTLGARASIGRAADREDPEASRPDGITPGEVAQTVAFLAGPHGASMNGACIPMDNGWTAH